MSYVLIEQNLEEEDEPRFIYAELDSGRREDTKIPRFDGKVQAVVVQITNSVSDGILPCTSFALNAT